MHEAAQGGVGRLSETVDRWARIVGTGASFALFGVGALLLGLVAQPILVLGGEEREQRQLRMQWLIHRSFRLFVGFMERVGVVSLEVHHAERLPRVGPALLVANHPSLLDYVFLVSQLPQADCVVKREHWANPVTGAVVRAAGYVRNDSGESTLDECVRRLRAGRIVLLFPEGTRSPEAGLGRFQRGTAHVALATGLPAIPITIRCEPRGLMRGQAWYEVPERRMRFSLEVGQPIASEPAGLPRARASRALTGIYREHFEKRLHGVPS